MIRKRTCPYCAKLITGRPNKKFCNKYCRIAHHNTKRNKTENQDFYTIVLAQLKLNRKILSQFNKGGKAIVRKNILINQGFNPNYFTHYWKSKNNNIYFFVFEYGFLKTIENGKHKFVLIHWQAYMNLKNSSSYH